MESYQPGRLPEELVEASLDHPIGSPKLEELVGGKKTIVTRITRALFRPKSLRPLRRIRSAQPDANIKILVATGFHRPSTKQELIDKYGQEILDHEQIVMHIATNDAGMMKIGTPPLGGECIVNPVQPLAAGMESDAKSILQKKHMDGLKRMKEANRYAEWLLANYPQATDAYIALGIADYVIGSQNAGARLAVPFRSNQDNNGSRRHSVCRPLERYTGLREIVGAR